MMSATAVWLLEPQLLLSPPLLLALLSSPLLGEAKMRLSKLLPAAAAAAGVLAAAAAA